MKRSKSNARVKVPDNHSVAVIPPLDANQRAVIARLGTSREKWQVGWMPTILCVRMKPSRFGTKQDELCGKESLEKVMSFGTLP